MPEKIAVFKTGWCDCYTGDLVEGNYGYIKEFRDGHERYNFKPGPNGFFYGYTHPIADKYPPSPTDKNGWLIFMIAKRPSLSGLYLVGWYANASFVNDYTARPEYESKLPVLEKDLQGNPFSYIVSAPKATLIPAHARQFRFDGSKMRRAPVYYLRGNGSEEPWRSTLAESLLEAKAEFESTVNGNAQIPMPGGSICADASRRKEVEEAAVAIVRAHFAKGYVCVDRQKDCCGFDLLFSSKRSQGDLHVEVKGTAGTQPHFFMSENEYSHARQFPEWRLAMVTNALNQPLLEIMTYDEARRRFEWKTFTWHATERTNIA